MLHRRHSLEKVASGLALRMEPRFAIPREYRVRNFFQGIGNTSPNCSGNAALYSCTFEGEHRLDGQLFLVTEGTLFVEEVDQGVDAHTQIVFVPGK
jgi:hypothetical protein